MERLFVTLSMVLMCLQLQAQTIFLQEDFSTASGATPPAGWTVQTAVGDPLVDVWHFDNPGRRSPASPITSPYACFDSDKLSNNGLAEEVYLTSPVFNATTTDNIILEFDQYFQEGFGGFCSVEVFNGNNWASIYTNYSSKLNPHHSTFDITTLVQHKTNAQVRFKWTGNYSWFWIVDNIKIYVQPVITEQFTVQTSIILTGVTNSSTAWGDYDNDGDLDILLTGSGISKIYRNNGDNSFTEQTTIALTGVDGSDVEWGDFDNDGDLDFLLTGYSGSGYISRIYRNNGSSGFTEQTSFAITGVTSGSAAWGDYDNDGDLDILLTGYTGSGGISKIYSNNGDNMFIEQTGISLTGVYMSSTAWGDYDKDGDLDILLTGYSGSVNISKIYRNNGDNSFTEQTGISLTGVQSSSAAWCDYDNDSNLDILLTGSSGSGYISKIYISNGDNSFTEQTDITLTGICAGSIAWGDYDNDGDPDILLTGSNGSINISRIYRNDGNNSFTEQTGIALAGVSNSSVAWGDYDNDGDLDILLTGSGTSKIYRNNNSVKNTVPSVPVNLNAVVDNQKIQFSWDKSTDAQTQQPGLNYNIFIGSTPGAPDVVSPMSNTANGFRRIVQTGNRSGVNSFTFNSSLPAGTYYWGVQAVDHSFAGSSFATGTFTITVAQAANLKFTDITTESVKIRWTRGNREKCAVFMKQDGNDLPVLQNNTSYTADSLFGKGSQAGAGWYCIYNGTGSNVNVSGLYGSTAYKTMVVEYSGISGQEIYLTASNSTNPQTCYTQEQFTEQKGISLAGVSNSSVAWGDYDNDGDLDILLTGGNSIIYRNDGNNSFTEQTGIVLTGVFNGSVAWGDYDNDSDLDILLTGYIVGTGSISKIYRNNGSNSFTEQTSIVLTGVSSGSVAWGDYDNDGDLDILLTGYTGSSYISKIYRNNGSNSFTEQTSIVLTGVFGGSVAWGDYDNDSDLDILLTTVGISKIYCNNGNNTFTEQTEISLPSVSRSSVAWGDYDNDGDLDILLSGETTSDTISKIYRNNRDNSFTEQTGIVLTGVYTGSVVWGDYDNDGDLDILLTGYIGTGSISKIYRNNGSNSFTEQTSIVLTGVSGGSVAWGDYDNDGDLDILLTGEGISKIYRNNNSIKNTAPSVPFGLFAYLSNKKLEVSWDKATDVETPQQGLTYNLRIGTTPGGCEILSPMALPNGKHKIATFGNVGHNTKWIIDLSGHIPLPEHIYYSVQAIDDGFLAGEWSPEKSEISDFVADFVPNSTCQKTQTQFQDKSYSILYPITIYQWKFTEGSVITTSSLQNPGYTFQTAGTHQVELTITNSSGATTSRIKTVTVLRSPLSGFNATTVCQGVPVMFDNITDPNTTIIESWIWDFGDNTVKDTVEEPGTHGYLNPGEYTVKLFVTAGNGCTGSIQKTVSVITLPVAAISADAPLTFCIGDSVTLSTSINPDYSYKWILNGTAITNAVSNSFLARQSGDYTVEVVTSIANCAKTSNPVTVTTRSAPVPPTINADGNNEFCHGNSVTLSVTNIPGNTYQWKLNGGAIGLNSNQIVATSTGTYSVTISNSSGCVANSNNSINVVVNSNPTIPTVNINGATSFCQGGGVDLSVANNLSYTYQWQNAGINISGATSSTYSVQNSGIYSLNITNSNGCISKTENVTVNVSSIPEAPSISSDGSLYFCQGDSVTLSITNIPGNKYQWKLNGGAVGLNSSKFVAKNSGSYTILVSNSNDCSVNSTNSVTITVNEPPRLPSVSLSGPARICEGDSLAMSVPLNAGYSYQWLNAFGPITGKTRNNFAAKTAGQYSLQVSNEKGCYVISSPVSLTVTGIPFKPVIITENYQPGKCNIESPITIRIDQPVTGYIYQWKRNGIPMERANLTYIEGYLSMGEYTVEVNNDGCKNESKSQTIFFENALEKPLIYARGPLVWYLACSNDSAAQYKWYYNGTEIPGADKHIYVANQTLGNYYVSIANKIGCITASDVIKIPTGVTGIEDIDPFAGLKIYPNPTSRMFIIEMENQIFGELLIRIISQEGKQVFSIKLEKTSEYFLSQVDLIGQMKGMYLINLMIDKHTTIRKVIIE